jgi:hypothetical protein
MVSATTQPAPLRWEQRITVGAAGEGLVIAALLAAGWSVIPHGAARVDSPPAQLLTPRGYLRATDALAWPPHQGRPWVLEIKTKIKLDRYPGWGFDPDDWTELTKHNVIAGPVLVIFVDPQDGSAWCASVTDMQNQNPQLTNNRQWLVLLFSYFIPLSQFLEKQTKGFNQ